MAFFGLKTVVSSDANEVMDFEDTYDDRLGDALEETNDDLNDETFGESTELGKDFDFAGQTAKVAGTLDEEQYAYARTSRPPQAVPGQPIPADVPSLQPIASLWGGSGSQSPSEQQQQKQPQQQQLQQQVQQQQGQPKVLSLEEVEAQMMAQRQQPHAPHQFYAMPPPPMGQYPPPPPNAPFPPPPGFPMPPDAMGAMNRQFQQMGFMPMPGQPPPQGIAQAPSQPQAPGGEEEKKEGEEAPVPLSQVMNEDQAKSQVENDKLLQKSRKIAQIVKYNGLMSQWDRNFIMRIQLQQMVTDDPYNEDFYYQVHSAIQARNNPQQPLNSFAQTYLFQRGQRGGRFRRHDNPLQRMQQQVQQAVERAREHPKSNQVVREGALGRISMGSGKQPRRALNVAKKVDSPSSPGSATAKLGKDNLAGLDLGKKTDTKYTTRDLLKNIEAVYSALLEVESRERGRPQDGSEEALKEWETKTQEQVDILWDNLKVTAPADANNVHPFVLMLTHNKGKKAIPRVFRHIDQKQRLTVLTRIIANIDALDVVKDGAYVNGEDLNAKARESVDLFSHTVLPPLVHLISESPYDVVVGLLEIMLNSSNIVHVASTKIGLAFLTVLISRAELIKQQDGASADSNWQATFNSLFTSVQGHLSSIFPPRNVDDSYVWHFLASLALAAKLDHQRIMVDEVREKIFGTMAEAKALPVELGTAKISNLNLFLNVMGLNATTTEIGELEGSN